MSYLLVAAFAALVYLGTAAAAIARFSGGWVTFAAGFPLLYGAWRWMRRRRTQNWQETALVYDELPEPAVTSLHIDFIQDSVKVQPSESTAAPRTPFWSSLEKPEPGAAPFFRLTGLAGDLRYGLRLLRKDCLLSATVVCTLALGIGINVSVFTLLNALAFRPHVPHPEKLCACIADAFRRWSGVDWRGHQR